MPIVPSERTGISTSVPGIDINPSQYGAENEAIAGLGANLFKNSAAIFETIKEEEAKSAANQAYADDLLEVEQFSRDLSLRSSGGYVLDESGAIKRSSKGDGYKTMTEEFSEWSDRRFKDKQMALPSKLSQDLYVNSAQKIYIDKSLSIQNAQLESSVKNSNDSIDLIAMKAGNALANSPDLNSAYSSIDHVSLSIASGTGKLRNADASSAMITKYERSLSDDTFGGALSKSQSMQLMKTQGGKELGAYWLSVLQEQDQDSRRRKDSGLKTMASMLDPDKRASYIVEFSRLMKESSKMNISDLNQRITATKLELRNAKPGQKVDVTRLIDEVRNVDPDHMTQFQKGENISSLYASDEFNKFIVGKNEFKSEAEALSLVDEGVRRVKSRAALFTDPKEIAIAGVIQSADTASELTQIIKVRSDQRKTDFAKYAKEKDPEIAAAWSIDWNRPDSFTNNVKVIDSAIEKARGPIRYGSVFGNDTTYWRPIDKDDSARFGNMITNAKDTAVAAKMIKVARGMKNFPDLMDQVIKDKNLPPQYRVVAIQPEFIGIQDTLSLMGAQGKSVRDLFNQTYNQSGKMAATDFTGSADPALGAFIQQSLIKSGMNKIPKEEIVAISELIETKAQDIMLKGYAKDPKSAWKQATDSMLGRHIHIVPIGGAVMTLNRYSGGKELTQYQADAIGEYVRDLTSEAGLKRIGVDIPKNKKGETLVPEATFFSQVAKTKRAVESSTRDKDGDRVIQVTYQDLLRNVPVYVMKDGKPLTIKVRDAERMGLMIKGEGSQKQPLQQWFRDR